MTYLEFPAASKTTANEKKKNYNNCLLRSSMYFLTFKNTVCMSQ